MIRKSLSTAVAVLGSTLALAAGVPEVEAKESPADEKAARKQGASEPGAAAGGSEDDPYIETVLVETSLPYIPTSNTIATKLPLPLRLTPANIGIVGGPLLYEQNAQVLGDALRNVGGLNVQTQNGITDYFLIRGFDSFSSSLVLTDGASEPEATLYQMYNVERVEVMKGPGGFLYGSNPLSGTVNMVRKQPLPTRFQTFGLQAGSFNRREGNVDINLPNQTGSLAFRLNSVFREDDHFRDDMDSRQVGINPALAWRRGTRQSVNVNMEFASAEYHPDSGIPLFNNALPGVPRRRSYQSPFDFSEQDIYRFQVDWEKKLTDKIRIRNKTYHRDQEWLTSGTFFGGVVPNQGNGRPEVIRIQGSLDDRQRFTGNQFEAVMEFETGPVKHQILTGLEVARYADEFVVDAGCIGALTQFGCAADIDLFNPVETASSVTPIPGQRQAGDVYSDVVAPYVVDQIAVSEKVQFLVGARYDEIDFEDKLNPGKDLGSGKLSPTLGFVYAPTRTLSLYSNGSRSYAPPSARATGNLDPEDSRQLEIGVKKTFMGGKVQTTWAVYRLERDNIAITDDTGFTQQLGDQRADGVEFELVAEPMRRLRTFFSYAFNEAELLDFPETKIVGFDFSNPQQPTPIFQMFDRSGNTPSFAPKHIGNLWVSKKFPGGFGLAGGARHVSSQFIDEDNRYEIDPYTLVNAAVFYDFDGWRLKLNLNNVTDIDYEMRGFGAASVIPGNPFTAFVGVEFRLN